MKPFSLLIKPSSWDCNLRCRYCFYLGKRSIYNESAPRMSARMLQNMIQKFMAMEMPVHSFGWQGGEPTLMGLDFFRRAVAFQQQFGHPAQSVSNGLQTNGTLLNDEWGKFLRQYNFLVGVSIDGPAELHDRGRTFIDGHGSHAEVMRGMETLRRNKVDFNALTLVSAFNQEHPLEIYRYLKNQGINYHQYIECVEFDQAGKLLPFAVKPGRWGEFLCTIFDEWFKNDTRKISVRLFDSILVRLVDGYANVCAMGTDCRQYFVVEHNGDVYPCDFHVRPELKLGNINDDEFDSLLNSKIYREFGVLKNSWNKRCSTCDYLSLCAGCCPKNRPGNDPANLSVLCEDWRLFYSHTIERFRQLAAEIIEERKRAASQRRQPSRNDPCPRGSGKKYKKCCGA
jgi:uncharacterized protein